MNFYPQITVEALKEAFKENKTKDYCNGVDRAAYVYNAAFQMYSLADATKEIARRISEARANLNSNLEYTRGFVDFLLYLK